MNLFLCILFLVLQRTGSSTTSSFSFYEFFQGDWELSSTAASTLDFEQFEIAPIKTFYHISKLEQDKTLSGFSYTNDSRRAIQLDFSLPNQGVFLIASEQEPTEFETLFQFSFDTLQHVHLSFGRWKDMDSVYQLLVTSSDSFTLTILPRASSSDILHVFAGSRIVQPLEKTFWQSYGTMFTIAGVIMFNMLIQRFSRPLEGAAPGKPADKQQ